MMIFKILILSYGDAWVWKLQVWKFSIDSGLICFKRSQVHLKPSLNVALYQFSTTKLKYLFLKCKFIHEKANGNEWNVFHAVPLKTTVRYGNARVRSVIIWHSISIFQWSSTELNEGECGKVQLCVAAIPLWWRVDASLRYFSTTDGQKRGRLERIRKGTQSSTK